MKLGKSGVLSNNNPITQLEYKIANDGKLYFDISNVDCGPNSISQPGSTCPFTEGAMLLHYDRGCDRKVCPPGEVLCQDAYNQPKDDWAVGACSVNNNNLVLYLCRTEVLGD